MATSDARADERRHGERRHDERRRGEPKSRPRWMASGDRVLEVLTAAKAPLKASAIVADTKAKPHQVMPLLRELVAAGQVERRGATVSLRYMLPGRFPGDAEA
jgi:hypothetical protein